MARQDFTLFDLQNEAAFGRVRPRSAIRASEDSPRAHHFGRACAQRKPRVGIWGCEILHAIRTDAPRWAAELADGARFAGVPGSIRSGVKPFLQEAEGVVFIAGGEVLRIGDGFQTNEQGPGCEFSSEMAPAFADFGLPEAASIWVETAPSGDAEYCAPLGLGPIAPANDLNGPGGTRRSRMVSSVVAHAERPNARPRERDRA